MGDCVNSFSADRYLHIDLIRNSYNYWYEEIYLQIVIT